MDNYSNFLLDRLKSEKEFYTEYGRKVIKIKIPKKDDDALNLYSLGEFYKNMSELVSHMKKYYGVSVYYTSDDILIVYHNNIAEN